MNYIFIVLGLAILALVFAFFKYYWVSRQSAGNEKMQRIRRYIADGALAFLRAEYRVMFWYVIIVAILLVFTTFLSSGGEQSSPLIAFSFIVGAICSGLAGFIGMRVATLANVRTTEAARVSLAKALHVAFGGGSVMGMCVVGLGLLGLGTLFVSYSWIFSDSSVTRVLNIVAGFGMGASSIALFARVGGGIYTKAADVGADLVGKVEAGIPEDHPLNPATIADNVGDNVGDISGMGADLFESYVGSILAAMFLGASFVAIFQNQNLDDFTGLSAVILPLVLGGLGIISSMIGILFVRVKDGGNPQTALNVGHWVASAIMLGLCYFAITNILPAQWQSGAILPSFGTNADSLLKDFTAIGVFWAVLCGLVAGMLVGIVTEYYTGTGKKPVLSIVKQSTTGSATTIIAGLGVGMMSTALPVILISAAILISYYAAGLYGIALAAVGMLANTGIQLAVDAYGPISDNAGGIAEMSELPKKVRDRTDKLDAVGNTTAAIGKGFAIASAAITALALFVAFAKQSGITVINLTSPTVIVGIFIGAMLPYVFSALAMNAVGRSAMSMIKEVRRQFKSIPALKKALQVMKKYPDLSKIKASDKKIMDAAEGKPQYARCVDISTRSAIREMILPGLIAIITPVVFGFVMGPETLGGLLGGVTVSGVLMAIFQSNAGGAWDNAKKMIEGGVRIGSEKLMKGSDAHKAAVVGDTVGDPLKDTSGPSINILIKLMAIVALVIAPMIKL